jgi:hypothetical protein
MDKKIVFRPKEGVRKFEKEVRNKSTTAILAAFAFVIALTWTDAIKQFVTDIIDVLGITGSSLFLKTVIALITTVICVIGILFFSRWSEKK